MSEAVQQKNFSIWDHYSADDIEAFDSALARLLDHVDIPTQPLAGIVRNHRSAFEELAEGGSSRACRILSSVEKEEGRLGASREYGWMGVACGRNTWDHLVACLVVLQAAYDELSPRIENLPMNDQADPLAEEAAYASRIIREIFESELFPPSSEPRFWLAEDEANTREILWQCGAVLYNFHRFVGRSGARVDGKLPGHAGARVMGLIVVMDWGPAEIRNTAQRELQDFLQTVGTGLEIRQQMLEIPSILPRLAELGEGWTGHPATSQ